MGNSEYMTCEVQGLDEFERKLTNLGPTLAKKALKEALEAGGEVMRAALVMRAPVGPSPGGKGKHPVGQLRDLEIEQVLMQTTKDTALVKVGPSKKAAFYGSFLEFGTSHEAAHPWVTPAFDESKDKAMQTFVDTMHDELDEAVREA